MADEVGATQPEFAPHDVQALGSACVKLRGHGMHDMAAVLEVLTAANTPVAREAIAVARYVAFPEFPSKRLLSFLDRLTDDAAALVVQALMYTVQWNDVEVDLPKAKSLLKQASKAGNSMGALQMAGMHLAADEKKEAVRWYTVAAERGNSVAAHKLGLFYDQGFGNVIKPDVKKAIQYYLEAAEAKNMFSMHNLGLVFREQDDMAECLHWLEQGVLMQYPASMVALGLLKYMGTDSLEESDEPSPPFTADQKEGIRHLRAAAQFNEPAACLIAGRAMARDLLNGELGATMPRSELRNALLATRRRLQVAAEANYRLALPWMRAIAAREDQLSNTEILRTAVFIVVLVLALVVALWLLASHYGLVEHPLTYWQR